MDLRFTYSQKCSLCLKKFKTFRSVQKHAEQKHSAEADRALDVVFLDNKEKEVVVPAIKAMDKRTQDFKLGYLSWLAGLTEQINASLNPHLRGRYQVNWKNRSRVIYQSAKRASLTLHLLGLNTIFKSAIFISRWLGDFTVYSSPGEVLWSLSSSNRMRSAQHEASFS